MIESRTFQLTLERKLFSWSTLLLTRYVMNQYVLWIIFKKSSNFQNWHSKPWPNRKTIWKLKLTISKTKTEFKSWLEKWSSLRKISNTKSKKKLLYFKKSRFWTWLILQSTTWNCSLDPKVIQMFWKRSNSSWSFIN